MLVCFTPAVTVCLSMLTITLIIATRSVLTLSIYENLARANRPICQTFAKFSLLLKRPEIKENPFGSTRIDPLRELIRRFVGGENCSVELIYRGDLLFPCLLTAHEMSSADSIYAWFANTVAFLWPK